MAIGRGIYDLGHHAVDYGVDETHGQLSVFIGVMIEQIIVPIPPDHHGGRGYSHFT
jgi:hypothetical protein